MWKKYTSSNSSLQIVLLCNIVITKIKSKYIVIATDYTYTATHTLFAAEVGSHTRYIDGKERHITSTMAHTDIPDAQMRIGSRDKDVPWYTDSIGSRLGPSARKLLEDYSHIPADQVESHIYSIVGPPTLTLPSNPRPQLC